MSKERPQRESHQLQRRLRRMEIATPNRLTMRPNATVPLSVPSLFFDPLVRSRFGASLKARRFSQRGSGVKRSVVTVILAKRTILREGLISLLHHSNFR